MSGSSPGGRHLLAPHPSCCLLEAHGGGGLPSTPPVCGLSSETRPLPWSPGTPHPSWAVFCCQQLNGAYQGLEGVYKPLTRDPAAWGLLGPPTRDRETALQAFPCPKLSPSWALPLTSSMPPTRVASSQRWILGKCASRAHPTPPGQGCGGGGGVGGHLLFSPHKVHLPWRCVLGLGVWLQDWGSTHFCQVATPRSFGGNRWYSILRSSS